MNKNLANIQELPSGLVKLVGWSVEETIEKFSEEFSGKAINKIENREEILKNKWDRHYEGAVRLHRLGIKFDDPKDYDRVVYWLREVEKTERIWLEGNCYFTFIELPGWRSFGELGVKALYYVNEDFDRMLLHPETLYGCTIGSSSVGPTRFSRNTFDALSEITGFALSPDTVVVERTNFIESHR